MRINVYQCSVDTTCTISAEICVRFCDKRVEFMRVWPRHIESQFQYTNDWTKLRMPVAWFCSLCTYQQKKVNTVCSFGFHIFDVSITTKHWMPSVCPISFSTGSSERKCLSDSVASTCIYYWLITVRTSAGSILSSVHASRKECTPPLCLVPFSEKHRWEKLSIYLSAWLISVFNDHRKKLNTSAGAILSSVHASRKECTPPLCLVPLSVKHRWKKLSIYLSAWLISVFNDHREKLNTPHWVYFSSSTCIIYYITDARRPL